MSGKKGIPLARCVSTRLTNCKNVIWPKNDDPERNPNSTDSFQLSKFIWSIYFFWFVGVSTRLGGLFGGGDHRVGWYIIIAVWDGRFTFCGVDKGTPEEGVRTLAQQQIGVVSSCNNDWTNENVTEQPIIAIVSIAKNA